jgi:hypothetical protein
MRRPHEHPVAVALAPLALGGAGRLPLMRCEGQRGSFISTGAKVHALGQVGGGDGNPLHPDTCVLSEPSLHVDEHGASNVQ